MLVTGVLRRIKTLVAAALTPSGAVAPEGAGEQGRIVADVPDSSAQGQGGP